MIRTFTTLIVAFVLATAFKATAADVNKADWDQVSETKEANVYRSKASHDRYLTVVKTETPSDFKRVKPEEVPALLEVFAADRGRINTIIGRKNWAITDFKIADDSDSQKFFIKGTFSKDGKPSNFYEILAFNQKSYHQFQIFEPQSSGAFTSDEAFKVLVKLTQPRNVANDEPAKEESGSSSCEEQKSQYVISGDLTSNAVGARTWNLAALRTASRAGDSCAKELLDLGITEAKAYWKDIDARAKDEATKADVQKNLAYIDLIKGIEILDPSSEATTCADGTCANQPEAVLEDQQKTNLADVGEAVSSALTERKATCEELVPNASERARSGELTRAESIGAGTARCIQGAVTGFVKEAWDLVKGTAKGLWSLITEPKATLSGLGDLAGAFVADPKGVTAKIANSFTNHFDNMKAEDPVWNCYNGAKKTELRCAAVAQLGTDIGSFFVGGPALKLTGSVAAKMALVTGRVAGAAGTKILRTFSVVKNGVVERWTILSNGVARKVGNTVARTRDAGVGLVQAPGNAARATVNAVKTTRTNVGTAIAGNGGKVIPAREVEYFKRYQSSVNQVTYESDRFQAAAKLSQRENDLMLKKNTGSASTELKQLQAEVDDMRNSLASMDAAWARVMANNKKTIPIGARGKKPNPKPAAKLEEGYDWSVEANKVDGVIDDTNDAITAVEKTTATAKKAGKLVQRVKTVGKGGTAAGVTATGISQKSKAKKEQEEADQIEVDTDPAE